MGIPFYTDETHPNYGVYKFKKGFNGEVVTWVGEFFSTFMPARKKLIDKAQQIVEARHMKHTEELIENRNTDTDA